MNAHAPSACAAVADPGDALGSALSHFREIWFVDFEFKADAGERPDPICLVAHELHSGRVIRLWRDQMGPLPPYPTDAGCLFVAYYASAEIGCHLALGWPAPERVLDLFIEFRNHTNGTALPRGANLLGALTYFGLDAMDATEKDAMRELAMRGGPWSDQEREALLDYCESDVIALTKLFPTLSSHVDIPRALLRGRYMVAAARIEHVGIPIDTDTLAALRDNWTNIQDELITAVDANYGVYEGRTFRVDRFAAYLEREGLPWPRTETGRLDLTDNAFREAARVYPQIAPLRELRVALSGMRLADLAVGKDGRNRVLLSPFRARTGRNQPSNSKFIFGPSVWLRGLIKPPPGYAVVYIDWKQQEFGIAAALSGDPRMLDAYSSGDPYLAFAKQTGAVPPNATKSSHKSEREQYKACVLAVQYGMEEKSLAARIGQPPIVARNLLQLHRETYSVFWNWSNGAVDVAMSSCELRSAFGWCIRVSEDANPRSLRNFPMQANGAEMLRLACCLGTEAGIEVCAPVHDAVLILAPLDNLDETVRRMQAAMAEASRITLNGFELGTDVEIVRYPNRYSDPRGAVMWSRVMELIERRLKKDEP